MSDNLFHYFYVKDQNKIIEFEKSCVENNFYKFIMFIVNGEKYCKLNLNYRSINRLSKFIDYDKFYKIYESIDNGEVYEFKKLVTSLSIHSDSVIFDNNLKIDMEYLKFNFLSNLISTDDDCFKRILTYLKFKKIENKVKTKIITTNVVTRLNAM
jgi:hypothetical protein